MWIFESGCGILLCSCRQTYLVSKNRTGTLLETAFIESVPWYSSGIIYCRCVWGFRPSVWGNTNCRWRINSKGTECAAERARSKNTGRKCRWNCPVEYVKLWTDRNSGAFNTDSGNIRPKECRWKMVISPRENPAQKYVYYKETE